MIPQELVVLLAQREREGWTGTVALNVKDGHIISISQTDTMRIGRTEGIRTR